MKLNQNLTAIFFIVSRLNSKRGEEKNYPPPPKKKKRKKEKKEVYTKILETTATDIVVY